MLLTLISVCGVLVCGSFAGFLRKVLFQIVGVGANGVRHPFEKPWFTTAQTTLGCALALMTHYISIRLLADKRGWRKIPSGPSDLESMASQGGGHDSDDYQPLMPGYEESRRRFATTKGANKGGEGRGKNSSTIKVPTTPPRRPPAGSLTDGFEEGSGVVTWAKLRKLTPPAILYQLGVIAQGIGLRYTSASVNQMISGSCIIFTAGFSVLFLQRKLNRSHWAGLLVACMGVGVVSISTLQMSEAERRLDANGHLLPPLEAQFTPHQVFYGIAMTILSQVIGAAQMVWEEAYLSDLRLAPLQVMGWEGVLGLALDVALFMPMAALMPGPDVGGVEEHTGDTLAMLGNSGTIRAVSVCFLLTVAGTSQFGIIVSSRLGSVFRALLLTARTVFIWVMDLAVFYGGVGPNTIGEGWSSASPLRAAGFALLLAGTALYCHETLAPRKVAGTKKNGGYQRVPAPSKEDVALLLRPAGMGGLRPPPSGEERDKESIGAML